jgi:hypothetical protein
MESSMSKAVSSAASLSQLHRDHDTGHLEHKITGAAK